MIRNYFKIAWRSLSHNKLYTVINILGLALGICACLVIFLITHFELSYDKFHPEKERIYRVVAEFSNPSGDGHKLGFVTDPMAMGVRAELSGLETVAGFYDYYSKVTISDGPGVVREFDRPKHGMLSDIVIAEPQYFDIFKYQWLAGTPALSLKDPFQVVLTEKGAARYFGPALSPDQYIGRQVIYSDSLHMTVSGIVKDWNNNTDFGFTDFISAATIPHSFLKKNIDLTSWGMWNYETQAFVKLAKGVSVAQINGQFRAFARRHFPSEEGRSTIVRLQPLSDIHFNDAYADAFSRKASLPTLYALMGIAVFILLIAAINFINLSTAQSIQRVKEIGIRKVLGSSRKSLILQFLVETFLLTGLAVVISVLLVNPVLSLFHAFIPPGLTFHLWDPFTLGFLFLLTLGTSLLAGFYPARVVSSYKPVISLKGKGGDNVNRKSYLRQSLIVFQFTIALLFIIGTAIIGDQIHFMLSQDMGFKKDAVINIQSPRKSRQDSVDKRDVLIQMISQIPGVSMICTSEGTPAAERHRGTELTWFKRNDKVKINAEMHIIDDRFVTLYDLKLLAGRNLLHSDTMTEVLLNESAAKALGFNRPEDAVGKMVESGQKDSRSQGKLPVVGVVADFHSRSPKEAVGPVFMTSNSSANRLVSVKLVAQGQRTAEWKNTMAKIEKDWKELYPKEKFEFTFFDETIAAFYDKEQKTSRIVNAAMLISIFISCMGLFGVTTFMAAQRTKEIGIRKVMGASVQNILRLLSVDFVRLIIISFLIASPIAYYFMHHWLEDFAYRMTIQAGVFIGSGLAALAIALLTVSFQTIRAATANPVESLRAE